MSISECGLVLAPVGIIVIILIVCILTLIGCCSVHRWLSSSELIRNPAGEKKPVPLNLKPYLVSSFKYKKGNGQNPEIASEATECVVCLTDFEDEEYVQQLPQCRHSFHAPCLDMWLYSHSDCPLCRTPVQRLDSESTEESTREENSLEGLLGVRITS